jgi:hypothetical protein
MNIQSFSILINQVIEKDELVSEGRFRVQAGKKNRHGIQDQFECCGKIIEITLNLILFPSSWP